MCLLIMRISRGRPGDRNRANSGYRFYCSCKRRTLSIPDASLIGNAPGLTHDFSFVVIRFNRIKVGASLDDAD